jgi:hypothetical protein
MADFIVTMAPGGAVSHPSGATISLQVGDVITDARLAAFLQTAAMTPIVTIEAITASVAAAIGGTGRTAPIVRH